MTLIESFVDFFSKKGHVLIPSSSLVPQDDTSVLLTTAGMQQFKSYYLGKPSPFGNRVISIQKCLRVDDIDEVGDETHNTFFEMLGNFSFSYPSGEHSYFKEQAIRFGYEFIVEKLGLKIDYVTIFAGDDKTPRDTESYVIWQNLSVEKGNMLMIKEYGREDNFWGPTGSEGPCGPTTEIYVNGVEVWNIVFNQYYAQRSGNFDALDEKGVDTGGGYERLLTQYEGVSSVYDTSICKSTISKARTLLPGNDEATYRVLYDHIRAGIFMIADGIVPSNKTQGYILRRLLRKVFSILHEKENQQEIFQAMADSIRAVYHERYPELSKSQHIFFQLTTDELHLFTQALNRGMKHAQKILRKKRVPHISGEEAFLLASTYGLSAEVMKLNGVKFDEQDFLSHQIHHQKVSRAGVEKKFGGHGLLLDNGEIKAANKEELEKATRLHSATHLLNQSLRDMFPTEDIEQKGSDITADRLRFDFTFPRKLSPSEWLQLQDHINMYIREGHSITIKTLPLEKAKATGALYLKNRSYPDEITVYSFGTISHEFCGGPHVSNTSDIGEIILLKQESIAHGVRRIKAILKQS